MELLMQKAHFSGQGVTLNHLNPQSARKPRTRFLLADCYREDAARNDARRILSENEILTTQVDISRRLASSL